MERHERFNSLSHALGGVLATVGTIILIVIASEHGDPWSIVSFSVYGLTLIFLYTSSSLYHALGGRARRVFRRLDHAAIYLLIAGTYTPFAFGPLRGAWGWSLFGVLWGLAVLGIVQEFIPQRTRRMSMIFYILMGWLIIIVLNPLMRNLAPGGLAWLTAGGLFYSLGVIFFVFDEKWRFGHETWHLFVLAGSIAQYGAILPYIALPPAHLP